MKCGSSRNRAHSWSGCVCGRCGKTRDEGHDFVRDGIFTVCTICGEKKACYNGEEPAAAGPVLQDGLSIKPRLRFDYETNSLCPSGADVFFGDKKVLSVNELGRQLLDMADGTFTTDEMAIKLNIGDAAPQIGMFFVKLGQSGYLKDRFEMMLYENSGFVGDFE